MITWHQVRALLIESYEKMIVSAFLFNCTPEGRTSDSMTVRT